jgi:hypothetical protein
MARFGNGDTLTGTRQSDGGYIQDVRQVDASGAATAAMTTGAADGGAASTSGSLAYSRNYIFNGTTWDRQRKANIFKRVASSAASGNPDFVKASAGDLKQFWGLCGATATYLQIYNKATAPVVGTDTPVITFPLVANAAFSQSFADSGSFFSTGISFAFTTDAAGTTAAAAAAVTAFAMMAA